MIENLSVGWQGSIRPSKHPNNNDWRNFRDGDPGSTATPTD